MASSIQQSSENRVRIHYRRQDGEYGGWTLYVFGDTLESTAAYYDGPIAPAGQDTFGAFFDVTTPIAGQRLGFILHRFKPQGGDQKDPGTDMYLDIGQFSEGWVLSGDGTVYTANPLTAIFFGLEAHWLDETAIAIPPRLYDASWAYALLYSNDAALRTERVECPHFELKHAGVISGDRLKCFPQLTGYVVFELSGISRDVTVRVVKAQLCVVGRDISGKERCLTGVQIAGVLDQLFAYDGELGARFWADRIDISVWAPTAQLVTLLLFDAPTIEIPTRVAMEESRGVWSARIGTERRGGWYLLEVRVYVPSMEQIVTNRVTDPYSVDLAVNGTHSRLTDLGDQATKPAGWDQQQSPDLEAVNDLSIYELHVRDFSIADASLPGEERGTYLAFSRLEANGMRHLAGLARAGLKAIHLLPTFHIASVNEDKKTWKHTGDLSQYAAESTEQQAAITAIKDADGYNWGYDPVHYLSPSGAYAKDPEWRVMEYRRMVQSLHGVGLRVIQDAVFNHTSGGGQTRTSVLDKIVPTYYHRLDAKGKAYNSSCCPNTASEHLMMQKLMVDALVCHARHYKIDGFRFDLMNFHTVGNLKAIQGALSRLTLENDGVDGSKIYLYGEGWSFGELFTARPTEAATQGNLYGTGVGSFNDRIRDAVRGGSPFADQRAQGFATALGDGQELRQRTDWIKIALAGGLRDFRFTDASGKEVTAGDLDYLGQKAGYTAGPAELINYCSVHDNQTLFDAVQLKSPASDSTEARARRQVLAMSIVALGQGIPFFMAGDDLLRSKDMDHNSYNSGDWFNKIDWTYQTNNWAIGLPIARENESYWPLHRELLRNPTLKPAPADIAFTRRGFEELLQIRYSLPLFRLRSAREIQDQVRFLDSGPKWRPGVIVMQVLVAGGLRKGSVLVVFNAGYENVQVQDDSLKELGLALHPVQASSHDEVVRQSRTEDAAGQVFVPGLTTAVFVSQKLRF